MDEALVVFPDGTARRMPAGEAEAFAARNGLHVLTIAWDGAKQGPGGPYLSTGFVVSREAPRLRPAPHGSLRGWL